VIGLKLRRLCLDAVVKHLMDVYQAMPKIALDLAQLSKNIKY